MKIPYSGLTKEQQGQLESIADEQLLEIGTEWDGEQVGVVYAVELDGDKIVRLHIELREVVTTKCVMEV